MQATDLPLKRLFAVVVAVGAMLVLAGLAANTEQLWFDSPEVVALPSASDSEPDAPLERNPVQATAPDVRSPMPDWVAAALLITMVAVLLYLSVQHLPKVSLARLRAQRFSKPVKAETIDDEAHDEEVIRVTTDLIHDLSLEGDPRAAIQRAYAAVETGFGSRELARKPAETPKRYLDRVFGRRLDQAGPLQQLTSLFETARFSTQPVTEDMRTEAIEAVSQIRDQYRARRRGRVT